MEKRFEMLNRELRQMLAIEGEQGFSPTHVDNMHIIYVRRARARARAHAHYLTEFNRI